MSHAHDHHHDHDHDHAPIVEETGEVSEYEVLETAIRELLIEKGVLTAADVHAQIDFMDSRGEALGAKVIARAWADEAFRARLLADARSAVGEMDIDVGQIAELVAVQNTDRLHHVVTCTLCSCYPRMVLGVPPAWYKSTAYRARVVADPRGVLAEFGVDLPPDTSVKVLDSTADMRYLVIPVRPAGTEGWPEADLARLVTRDSMIGTGLPRRA